MFSTGIGKRKTENAQTGHPPSIILFIFLKHIYQFTFWRFESRVEISLFWSRLSCPYFVCSFFFFFARVFFFLFLYPSPTLSLFYLVRAKGWFLFLRDDFKFNLKISPSLTLIKVEWTVQIWLTMSYWVCFYRMGKLFLLGGKFRGCVISFLCVWGLYYKRKCGRASALFNISF